MPTRQLRRSSIWRREQMARLAPDLSNEWDKGKLRNWMANAKRHKRDDIYQDAFRQLCRIEGRNIDDPLEAEFAVVMRALEHDAFRFAHSLNFENSWRIRRV